MRKLLATVLTVMMIASLLVGCVPQNGPANKYKDGDYFAASTSYDEKGFKDFVNFKVSEGKINNVVFDSINSNAKETKSDMVKAGKYPMVESGKAIDEWDVQADRAADYLVQKQDPSVLKFNDEGKTDEITGVSIVVNDFFVLAKEALDNGPSNKGQYTDGYKHAQNAKFDDNGWKSTVDIYVRNGTIIAANWDGLNEKGESKKQFSKDGKYPMVEEGKAQSEWYVQAGKAAEFLVQKQEIEVISLDNEGKTDAVTGVSINVGDFVTLAKEALNK